METTMRSDARKREASPSEAGTLTESEQELIDSEGGRFDRESMYATVARIKTEAVQAERESIEKEIESLRVNEPKDKVHHYWNAALSATANFARGEGR